jgi:hypothetical protein
MVVYLIGVPILVMIFFKRNKNNKIARRRFKPTLIMTFKLFIYSLFDLVYLVILFLNVHMIQYQTKENRPYLYLIEIIVGYTVETEIIHTYWFNILIWIYQVCYSFHVLVLIGLHNTLNESIKDMFGWNKIKK